MCPEREPVGKRLSPGTGKEPPRVPAAQAGETPASNSPPGPPLPVPLKTEERLKTYSFHKKHSLNMVLFSERDSYFLNYIFCVLQILYNEHEILSSLGGKGEMFIKCFEQRKLRNLLKDIEEVKGLPRS